MLIELKCPEWRGDGFPFKVELLDYALKDLVCDAQAQYRVYELFSIRRPGDIWKYLWVKLIDVPQAVVSECERHRATKNPPRVSGLPELPHPWSEGQMPLPNFDAMFFRCGDDTEPVDDCWLRERESKRVSAYASELFESIKAAQLALSRSKNALLTHEIAALASSVHSKDYEPDLPFMRTSASYETITRPGRPAVWYEKLRELLRSPDVNTVSMRGGRDYCTVRCLCEEQRVRGNATGLRTGKAFGLRISSDDLKYPSAWQAEINYHSEGLGPGDLWVELSSGGAPIKDLVEKHGRDSRYFYSARDEGAIADYSCQSGGGWYLYTRESG